MTADESLIPKEYLTPERGALLLEKLPIFAGFAASELVRIYAMGELRLYKPASNIIVEGEASAGMYVILEGQVGIFKAGRGSQDEGHLLVHLGPGACFGEMSFVDHQPRSATVVAQNKVLSYFLDGKVWQKALDTDVQMAERFYKNFALVLSTRLRTLDEQFILSQKQLWKYSLSRRNDAL
jgi:CRP-like cAMP-binding protein